MRYLKSALNTLKRKKWKIIIITFFVMLAFSGIGYIKGEKDIKGISERQEKIDEYLSQVKEYEKAIADSKLALAKAEEQLVTLKEYADKAVYMKLDSNNVWVGSVQYTVLAEEGTDIENVINAINLYITQGGLKEDTGNEQEELGVKYWGEVIGTNIGGQNISITIMQSSEDFAKRSIELIKKRIVEHTRVVKDIYGAFELAEQETSVYVKSDAGIVNTQNARRNDLKNYETNHSDLITRVFNQQNTLSQYIENNKPDSLEINTVSVVKTAGLFAVIGLFVGIWISVGISLIDYFAGNRIKNATDVKKYGLEILGINDLKNGFLPDVGQTAAEINELVIFKKALSDPNMTTKGSVALFDIAKSDDTMQVCEEYLKALKDIGDEYYYVDAAATSASSLKKLLGCGSVVIIVSAGDSCVDKIQEALCKFEHYGICCLGAIVLI